MTAASSGTARWLVRRRWRPDASVGLYCFAHAGGSLGEYLRWSDDLPGLQLWGVHLPGRTSRSGEPPFTRMAPLVEALVTEIRFARPFVFFGHSLGALVAFEVARELRRRDREQPVRLVLSSCPAPPIARAGLPLHALPDAGLLAEIERRWGALSAELRTDPDLLAHTLACHRADLELLETYRYRPGEPLDVPITALAGTGETSAARVRGWAAHTRAPLTVRLLPGGHFYFRERRDEALRALRDAVTGGPPSP
ncbi:thioesterase II family protein [Actinoallomurus sp. CA-142502]|uniref:thioesterase II family protein n=1 Tax=Actinoallomurus sp. CA-142502 TaxID=3239885 RepID=UPI003D8C866C